MIRLLIRALVYLISAAIGVVVADAVLDGVHLHVGGFIVAIVIFALAQLILEPAIFRLIRRNAQAFLGGVGLVSTFVALLLATVIGNGIEISGVGDWIAATVIVWLVTAIGTMVVPFLLAKAGVQAAQENKQST